MRIRFELSPSWAASDQSYPLTQQVSRQRQVAQLKRCSQVLRRTRRICPAGTHFLDCAHGRDLVQLQLVHHKLIGVLNFNAVRLQNCFRKIFGVESDDSVRVAHDGGGYDRN